MNSREYGTGKITLRLRAVIRFYLLISLIFSMSPLQVVKSRPKPYLKLNWMMLIRINHIQGLYLKLNWMMLIRINHIQGLILIFLVLSQVKIKNCEALSLLMKEKRGLGKFISSSLGNYCFVSGFPSK